MKAAAVSFGRPVLWNCQGLGRGKGPVLGILYSVLASVPVRRRLVRIGQL